jgi:hypothetical protein
VNRWLSWLNAGLLGGSLILGLATVWLWLKSSAPIEICDPHSKNCLLPKGFFESSLLAYEKINGPLLALEQLPFNLQVPDLRQQLIYYGKNGRPDGQQDHTLLHFSLSGSKTIVSVAPGDKIYLSYDRKSTPNHYIFSPQNEKTNLWIEAKPIEQEVQVHVTLENDQGELVTEPENYATFRLPEKEFTRHAGIAWEIGAWRVDGTLLARQRARWFGPDRFLEHHGGSEYQEMASKQRIDFGENDDVYSVLVKVEDCLIWKNNQWHVVTPGEESLNHPLLVIKKVEDRLMNFELWDVEGKGKVILNLLKSNEPWTAQNTQALQNLFKFVGARTRTQCVFEINHERVVLSPSDWMLQTPKGWKKLVTEEEIDNYVKRKTVGNLFVFEGVSRKDEHQVMKGTLYNSARNDFQEIELALQVGSHKQQSNGNPSGQSSNMTKEMQERVEKMQENLKDRAEQEERAQRVQIEPVKMAPVNTHKTSHL